MKFQFLVLASMLTFALALSAGTAVAQISDSDLDLVPDSFDNCRDVANGPNEGSNQVDTDQDGYGNACDPDYDNDNFITMLDFCIFLANFGVPGASGITDHSGDGATTTLDFGTFLPFFANPDPPGPSGLSCAGTVVCTP